ncbi:MAG: hypothetical protein JNK05_01145 [Myxococcales bacterium]|nr:hypothetical protein [Myxococcales bacterium]
MTRAIAHWGRADIDTDAYGHYIVARRALDAPLDLSVHWVWLPGWHVVHGLFDLSGLGFEAIRAFSLGCSLATVALLFWWVEREARELVSSLDTHNQDTPAPFATVAATVAALSLAVARPAIDAGGSGEPEALFSLLVLGAVASLRIDRPALAGALAAAAALTRYEAWPFVGALFVIERLDARSSARRAPRRALAWVLPAIAIGLWCVAHRIHSGEWLAFIRENRAFVARTLPRLHAALPPWPRRALQYPVIVPWASWGVIPIGLCAIGAVIAAKRRQASLFVAPALLLGFLTYSWVRGQHLGLVRHAVAYLPFYAAAIGVGAASALRVARSSRVAQGAGGAALGLILCARGVEGAREHRASAEHALVDERRAAEVLRAEAGDRSQIFCDVAAVEVFSRAHRSRFIRWNGADIRPYNLTVAVEQRGGAWVVSRPERVRALLASSVVRYESPRLVVLRANR